MPGIDAGSLAKAAELVTFSAHVCVKFF